MSVSNDGKSRGDSRNIAEETRQKAREMEELGVPRTVIGKKLGIHRVTLLRWFGPKDQAEGAA